MSMEALEMLPQEARTVVELDDQADVANLVGLAEACGHAEADEVLALGEPEGVEGLELLVPGAGAGEGEAAHFGAAVDRALDRGPVAEAFDFVGQPGAAVLAAGAGEAGFEDVVAEVVDLAGRGADGAGGRAGVWHGAPGPHSCRF